MSIRLTLPLVYCLLSAPLQAAPSADVQNREYLCRATAVPPTIDGDLSDPCWQQAQAPPVFWELGAYGKEMPGLVKMRFLCDDANLYVAADVRSAPGRVPAARRKRLRDQRVFMDDSIELYLHTAPADLDAFCFMVNCDNAILDSCTHKSFRGQERPGRGFNPEWRHATTKRKGGWSVEMAIPFKELVDRPPPKGWVWRVRVGHNSAFGHAMWPRNESNSFHEPTCSGYLIFRDRNLLANGNFEGAVDKRGRPVGWTFSYNDKEGKGIIQLWDKNAPEGKRCIRYEKFKPYKWFPQLWSSIYRHQPHSTYRYSFLINSPKRFVVRYSFYNEEGRRVIRRSTTQLGTKGFERRELLFRVEDEAPKFAVGLQLSRTDGVFFVDDVRVERVNGMEFKRKVLPRAHRYHRLERLAERRPFKPYDQVVHGDQMQSERVIFKDTATGAQIWRLSDTPGGSTRHFYMEASPWNCDGSILMLRTSDWGLRANLRYAPDGSTITRLPYATSWWVWDRRDPSVFYVAGKDDAGKSTVFRYNIDTGERTALKRYEGSARVWAVSQDNKYLLIKEQFYNVPWRKRSMIHLLSIDGKEDIPLDPKGHIHQLWFTKLPDHSVEFEYEHHGGYKPGDYPDGNYMMTPDGRKKLIYGGPGKWAGHRAHSPSGRYMVPNGRLQRVDKLTGEIRLLGPGGANHMTWEADESWLAASSGPNVIRFAADGRDFVQRIGSHNSGIGHSTYWTEAHVEMSPDGTKLGYASSMLGDIDFYFMVMMLPGRPVGLTATRIGRKVRLTWQPPKHAKEIAGYLVYRSRRSGRGYEIVTRKPVAACMWIDSPGDGVFYYQVASLERSGLEGLKSNEACTDPAWPGPLRHVFECEFAPVTKPPAMEAFDTTASGLYAMNLGKDEPAKDFAMPFAVPRDGTYALWLRIKSCDNPFALRATLDEGKAKTISGKPCDWTWLKIADRVKLSRGQHSLALVANVPYVLIDQLVVTDEPSPQFGGAEGADTIPPPPPKSLSAKATGRYTVRVEWDMEPSVDFHHFNLYVSASPECEVKQENLIASPPGRSYVHWGLLAGTTYYYRLTAVDRAGNESAPTAVAKAQTEPITDRLFVRFDKSWKTREAESTSITFDCPSETNIVLWTKWQCFDSDRRRTKGAFGLRIDGKSMGRQGIRFGYICRGHGGPVPGHWLWNFTAPLVERDGKHELGYRIGKGKHTIEIVRAAKRDDLECASIIVTNDFGFLPSDGYTSFLPMRGK